MSSNDSFFIKTAEKYIAARNALIAKYTFDALGEDEKQRVDAHIVDMLIACGIRASRAPRYRSMLRETQYYGMAALAMALIGIPPALSGVLFKERWENVHNPLVALTNAEMEIRMVSREILRKHQVLITISDLDKQVFNWGRVLPALRSVEDMN